MAAFGACLIRPALLFQAAVHFAPNGANKFSYFWVPHKQTLRLFYTPPVAAEQAVSARVDIAFSNDSWFDLQLHLYNGWDRPIDFVSFPSDLQFDEAAINAAYLPMVPGVALNRGFFNENRSYIATYPAPLYADFLALASTRGQLAFYSINTPDAIQPVYLGFNHEDGSEVDRMTTYHTYIDHILPQASWTSPVVRLRLGESVWQTAVAYRQDNRLQQQPSTFAKLGEKFSQVAQAPFLKVDMSGLYGQLGVTFATYRQRLFGQLPTPALLHLSTFWDGKFDEQYPDLLPPNPRFGSQAELQQLFIEAQELGLLGYSLYKSDLVG